MVMLPDGYAIDITEVTRSQYTAWLSTNPDPSAQPTYCLDSTRFQPDQWCMERPSVCQGSGCGQHPQVCVDWCDAIAYCQAVGKRLCGKIGGGANAVGDFADPTKSQWFNACSSGGRSDYSYGNAYNAEACNNSQTTVETGSLSTCQSSVLEYAGVSDLSGNVAEWEDSCLGYSRQADECRVRGGSFLDNNLRCDNADIFSRDTDSPTIGFRCCAP
jgi:formylglycine-generating enzyme required for sulfatase activity